MLPEPEALDFVLEPNVMVAMRDAVRLAVDDQLRAGADVITDGEMQRVDFNLGFYDRLTGLQPLPQGRRWRLIFPFSLGPIRLARNFWISPVLSESMFRGPKRGNQTFCMVHFMSRCVLGLFVSNSSPGCWCSSFQ